MISRLVLLLGVTAVVRGQDGTPVQISPVPFYRPVSTIMFYDGSNRLEYICQAWGSQQPSQVSVSAATNANPGVFTASGHGAFVTTWGYQPKVTLAGGTGNWTAANGQWIMLPTSTTQFTLVSLTGTAFDTSALGALAGSIVVTFNSPRTNQYQWYIRKFTYDGSANNVGVLTGYDSQAGFGRARCDDRATSGLVEYR